MDIVITFVTIYLFIGYILVQIGLRRLGFKTFKAFLLEKSKRSKTPSSARKWDRINGSLIKRTMVEIKLCVEAPLAVIQSLS